MVLLYSTGCPNCNILKLELRAAHIDYVEISDIDEIIGAGIDKVPVLEVEGVKMSLAAAREWIKSKGISKNEKQ